MRTQNFILRKKLLNKTISKGEYINLCAKIHQTFFDSVWSTAKGVVSKVVVSENGVEYQLKEPPVSFWYDDLDTRSAPIEAFNFGDYEKDLRIAFLKIVALLKRKKGVILDVGANVGWYSIIVGQQNPNEKILAFEPMKSVYQALQKNIKGNRLRNVEAFNLGLADQNKRVKFNFDSGCSVAAHITVKGNSRGVSSRVMTLDSFIQERPIPVKLIKADIEGAELLLLKGATNTLKRDKPVIICEMLRKWSARFNYHPNQLIDFMKQHGYDCYTLCLRNNSLKNFRTMTESTKETNFFFLHSKVHNRVVKALS